MKHVKMLGLFAAAVAALMAFAGVASATQLTSPAGTVYTGAIKASSSNSELDGAFVTVKCTGSTVEGTVATHGVSSTVTGSISSLTFTGCNYPTTVKKAGSLELHTESGSANGNGTLTSSSAEIEIATSIGTCIFTTTNTDVGQVTGGTTAKLDINSSKIPRTGGNFLCGSTGTWTGSYTVNTPDTLLVD